MTPVRVMRWCPNRLMDRSKIVTAMQGHWINLVVKDCCSAYAHHSAWKDQNNPPSWSRFYFLINEIYYHVGVVRNNKLNHVINNNYDNY